MSLADLPPLREVLAEHDLLANKSFGQHFLLDLNITRKIARLSEVGEGDVVIEVGPGPGGLTRALLETGARVVAVEMDTRFLPLLEELGEAADGRLTLVQGDALKVDKAAIAGGPAHMVSNLPYNVGTPLLINWLTGPYRPLSMTLMFQKEVADRIAADRERRRLWPSGRGLPDRLLGQGGHGPAGPRLHPAAQGGLGRGAPGPAGAAPPDKALVAALEKVTAAAFGQRRKMLRSSLKGLGGGALCEKAGINPDARAETIDVAGFQALARAVMAG